MHEAFVSVLQCNIELTKGMSTVLNLCLNQLGPEKGVIHLATAAVLNAVWDLWARAESKVGLFHELMRNYQKNPISFPFVTHSYPALISLQPLWKLLVDMVSHRKCRCLIYVQDVITRKITCFMCVNSGSQADCLMY